VTVDFQWDAAKRERNKAERGLPFSLAVELFQGVVIDVMSAQQNHGEVRRIAVGMTRAMTLVCVYADRGGTRRVISLRPANRRERDAYRAAVPN
jgi:hypothetical protein